MFQVRAKIVYNKGVKGRFFEMAFFAPEIAKSANPGQFVNIRINSGVQPLLRRPFSIHRIIRGNVVILYEVKGQGSRILSHKDKGDYLDVIGPLGNGFDIESKTQNLRPIIVAGGMGTAPLTFLAEKLAYRKPMVLIGAKTKKDILCEREFRGLGCEVKISTDDGSKGFKGYVSNLLEYVLSANNNTARRSLAGECKASPCSVPCRRPHGERRVAVYACGPKPMLKEISNVSQKHKIKTQVSLEEHMACGIGACMGCAVKTKNKFEYKRVCKDGPVFDAQELVWDKEKSR